MSFFQSLISQPNNPYDVFLVIGDSICVGVIDTDTVPHPAAGTAYEVVRGVGTFDPYGTSGHTTNWNGNSSWARFCIDYYTNTGRIPVIAGAGSNGSTISPASDNNDWQTSGSNYSVAVALANDALGFTGNSKLKGIHFVCGVNDVAGINGTGAFTVAQVRTYLYTVIDNLRAEFGNDVPILLQVPGRQNTTYVSARLTHIRNNCKLAAQTYDNVYVAANMGIFHYAGLYDDGTHPSPDGYVQLGRMFAEWYRLSAYSKWTRTIACNHLANVNQSPAMSDILIGKIETFMATYQAAYLKFDFLYWSWRNFMTVWQAPNKFDWALLCSSGISNGNYSVVSDDYVEFDGVDDFFDTAFNPALSIISCTQNDMAIGFRVKQGTTATGTLMYMMGITSGSDGTFIQQSTANNIGYNVNGTGTISMASQANIGAGHWLITRLNTNIRIYRDGVQLRTDTNTSTALLNFLLPFACRYHSVSGRINFLGCQLYGIYAIPTSAINSDIAAFCAAMDAMQD